MQIRNNLPIVFSPCFSVLLVLNTLAMWSNANIWIFFVWKCDILKDWNDNILKNFQVLKFFAIIWSCSCGDLSYIYIFKKFFGHCEIGLDYFDLKIHNGSWTSRPFKILLIEGKSKFSPKSATNTGGGLGYILQRSFDFLRTTGHGSFLCMNPYPPLLSLKN
jgi:hypothetical protein